MIDSSQYAPTVERFTGFADVYNRFRPEPPAALIDVLTMLAGGDRPRLVVDLGCGTGLSTRIWANRAERVVGVDPSDDMRRQAEGATAASNVSYQAGYGHATGLPQACADVVTCSSSIHWMEPVVTLAEVGRILRRGGVFAAFGPAWPPITSRWELDAAFKEFQDKTSATIRDDEAAEELKRWPKEQILDRMRDSGRFRHTKEIHLHQTSTLTADSFMGLVLSLGRVQTLLKRGMSESQIGLDRLREAARELLGDAPRPCYFTFCVRIGIV